MIRKHLRNSWLLLFCLMISSLLAQTDTAMVEYSIDFRFSDGVYINFNQVKKNAPTPFNIIISNKQPQDASYIDDLMSNRYLTYFDNGQKQNVAVKDVWGYAKNGILYVNIKNRFFRLTSIGAITLFIANIEVERVSSGLDPWGYYGVSRYNERYKTDELKRFLLNFEDGTMYGYHYKNVEALLVNDKELFEEYSSLKRRKRKQLAIVYLKKYNKKHPLYFPVYH